MGLSLNVHIAFGVEVPTSEHRAFDALDNHASIEAAPVGDVPQPARIFDGPAAGADACACAIRDSIERAR